MLQVKLDLEPFRIKHIVLNISNYFSCDINYLGLLLFSFNFNFNLNEIECLLARANDKSLVTLAKKNLTESLQFFCSFKNIGMAKAHFAKWLLQPCAVRRQLANFQI